MCVDRYFDAQTIVGSRMKEAVIIETEQLQRKEELS